MAVDKLYTLPVKAKIADSNKKENAKSKPAVDHFVLGFTNLCYS